MSGHVKTCTKCGETKPLSEFYTAKQKSGTLKHVARCKECTKAANRENAQKNVAAAVERVRQWRLLPGNMERKNKGERERRKKPETAIKISTSNKEYRSRPDVKAAKNAKRKIKRHTDAEFRMTEKQAQREYYNRPEIVERERIKRKKRHGSKVWRDKFNARRRERYAEDPDYLCSIKCRAMVVRVAKKASTKKDGNTHDILSYSAHDLRLRMECQFQPGMSWTNYGEWHIDHKKPIAAFIAQGIKDPRIINMLSNLQPMWGEENQKKSSAWPIAANDNKREFERAA
ncbi:hypothetical protein LB533_20450 [Mesorhizobium sp. BR1-1-13]|uniref:hypothetical protein n=1 Tax=Mesorhizobium sp. BR1-1-13 TaxID=2876656 RepID=UPI001CD0E951|nr:hypothetical protein [Mesorhizobium sp. BR1-1-13]MBZ9943460.1 hypothetical protein [Mesorhizobium sp. BR1-1-13]